MLMVKEKRADMSKFFVKNLWWLLLSVVVIAADQATKLMALLNFSSGAAKPVFPMLNFTLAFNKGAAFSFLSSAGGWQNVFFIALAVFVCAMLVVWLLQSSSKCQCAALGLIVGGAIGNVVDRLHYGHVVDFIDFHVNDWHWPVFNVADSAITVGVVLLLISYVLGEKKS
jgi:signal peptidase II